MRVGRKIQAVLVGLCGLSAGCFATDPVADAGEARAVGLTQGTCVQPEGAARLTDQVLQLVNLERVDYGLSPVITSPSLTKIAEDFACRMIEEGFFGHQDPEDGRGPGERAVAGKYVFFSIGENLASGQASAADVMDAWMESPAHREIILDPKWTEIGIAVREGGAYSIYWVQEFGEPADY